MGIDDLTELSEKILKVSDTEKRYKAIGKLQERIYEDAGTVIECCTTLVNENKNLRFSDFVSDVFRMYGAYNLPHKCLYLLTEHKNEVREYENDDDSKKEERKQKLQQYAQTVSIQLPPKQIIKHMGVRCYTEVIQDIHPDLIYCQHGTYRQYSEVCNTFYYRLGRKIQVCICNDNKANLKELFQKICLYISLNNEMAIIREELSLLGVDVPDGNGIHEIQKVNVSDGYAAIEKRQHFHKDDETKAKGQFERLINGGYFTSETSLNDWLYVYGVKGKEPNKKPLDWQKTQKELGYMVRSIWQNTDTRIWAICGNVFTIKGKRPKTNVIKSDLSSIDNGYKNRPETFDKLDEVLKG